MQEECPKVSVADVSQNQRADGTAIKGGDGWWTHCAGDEALDECRWEVDRLARMQSIQEACGLVQLPDW